MNRLLSLDVFRGMTIAFMILVNNPGSWGNVYSPLLHADWNGCTPTDLVFPFFVFIVGVSIPFAFSKRLERGDAKGAIYKKIIKRVLIIFGIGLFLNAFPLFDFGTLRIPGVLQRIALAYGFTAVIFLNADWKMQTYIGIGLLLLYWALMTLVPVPDTGVASLAAETNLGAWIDRTLMPGHLWSQAKVWDPEGLLSTMPAVVTGMSGALTGLWLQTKNNDYKKLVGLLGFGAILILLGLGWDLLFPINKKIWTSSYVLYTSGIALTCLGLLYWVVDVLKYKSWIKPFMYFGMNALIIYTLSGILADTFNHIKWSDGADATMNIKTWLHENLFLSWLSPKGASLGYAILNVLILLSVAWWMYVKKIFVKV